MSARGGVDPSRSDLLSVRDLRVAYRTRAGELPALAGVDLDLGAGETLALVGESGSGKSSLALALLGLLRPEEAIVSGSIRWRGRELLGAGPEAWRAVRGAQIALVFQEPAGALDPVWTVGAQVAEAVALHERARGPEGPGGIGRRAARARAVELLARVEMPDPERAARSYPHELSGGMRQRALLATALAGRPALLVADEPTSALDAPLRAEIAALLRSIQRERGMALLLVTHELALAEALSERALVMYAGRVVECGPTRELFASPRHPYTRGLVAASPDRVPPGALRPIPGAPPRPGAAPGCPFAPRCDLAEPRCLAGVPPLLSVDDGDGAVARRSACVRAAELRP